MLTPDEHRTGRTPRAAHLGATLSLYQMFNLGFGATIGVGWVTVLGAWIAGAGSVGAAVAFAGGAAVMMLIALCYAELSSMYPESGGDMVYAHECFGVGAAFIVGWLLLLIFLSIMVFLAISAGWVVAELVPGWRGPVLYRLLGADVAIGDVLTAVVGIVAMAWLNVRGGNSAARFQDVATAIMCIAAVSFIGAGLLAGDTAHLTPLFSGAEAPAKFMGIAGVFATTPLWYAGFNVVPQAIGERSPGVSPRRVAQTMLLGLVAAMVFYVLLIVSASMALPREELLALPLPAAGAFASVLGSRAVGKIVLVAGLLGLVTSWNAVFFAGARVAFAMARARLLSPRLAVTHRQHQSPVGAVLLIAATGVALAPLGVGFIGPLVTIAGSALAVLFLVVALTVVRLRHTRPDALRPFRLASAHLVGGLAAIASLGMIVLNVIAGRSDGGLPLDWMILLAWLALGYAVWRSGHALRASISREQRRSLLLGRDPL